MAFEACHDTNVHISGWTHPSLSEPVLKAALRELKIQTVEGSALLSQSSGSSLNISSPSTWNRALYPVVRSWCDTWEESAKLSQSVKQRYQYFGSMYCTPPGHCFAKQSTSTLGSASNYKLWLQSCHVKLVLWVSHIRQPQRGRQHNTVSYLPGSAGHSKNTTRRTTEKEENTMSNS